MKLAAICSRTEYKDYYDLACLSKVIDVRAWLNIWSSACPDSDPIAWLVALGDINRVEALPLKGVNILSQDKVISLIKDIELEINKFLKFV